VLEGTALFVATKITFTYNRPVLLEDASRILRSVVPHIIIAWPRMAQNSIRMATSSIGNALTMAERAKLRILIKFQLLEKMGTATS